MKWKKFKIKTVTDAEDIISATLGEIGVEGVQIEDKIPLSAPCTISGWRVRRSRTRFR